MVGFRKGSILVISLCLIYSCSSLTKKYCTPRSLLSKNSTCYNKKTQGEKPSLLSKTISSPASGPQEAAPPKSRPEKKIAKIKKSTPLKHISHKVSLERKRSPFNFVLKIKETPYTKRYFEYYSKLNRRTFQRWLRRAQPYLPYIIQTFRREGIPDDLAFLPFAESGFNPFAYSRAGAVGIWQFMAATARKYGLTVNWWVDERRDPYKSTVAAAKYLKSLYDIFQDWYLVLAAYNSGEGKILKAIHKSKKDSFFDIAKTRYLHRETRLYVPKFMAILKIIQNLGSLGFEPLTLNNTRIPKRVFVKGGVDLYKFASLLGLRWHQFKKLNPQFKRYVTPPDVISVIYVPSSLLSRAHEILRHKKIRPYGGLIRYRIKKGDSWWRISRRFRVPIYILKKINRTRSNFLTPNRYILIPKSPTTIYLASNRVKFKKDKQWIKSRGNYIVKQGDSLWKISRKFKIPMSTLLQANGLTRHSILKVGMRLYIPKTDTGGLNIARRALRHILYKVKKGDNLWNIARKFGVTTRQLISWNNLKKNSRIYPGDKIKIFIQD